MNEDEKTKNKSLPLMRVGVLILIVVFALSFWILNSKFSGQSISRSTVFPQQVQEILSCRWSQSDNQWGFSKPIGEQILESTGNSEYIGSLTYPITAAVSNADHGASYVSIKIKKGSGGTLADMAMRTNETVEFDYWVAQDGLHIRPENDNAQEIWTFYSNN